MFNKRRRVFIAINLPEYVKKALAKYQEKWSRPQSGRGSPTGVASHRTSTESGPELPAKWTNKDNLHITLEFLGNLTDIETADVCKIAGEVAKKYKSFSINLNKILYGPPKKMPPRMVWAEGERSEELAELKSDLQEELVEAVNYRPEYKGFVPHITLARIKEWEFKRIEPEERPEINEDIDLVFTVESIEVMESELKRGGPSYTILESRELKP